MNKIITKIDAASEQIDAAIEMYFISEKYLAVHTLVAAAYNVLHALAKHTGRPKPSIKSHYINTLDPKDRKSAIDFINSFENFLKHADRDPEGTIIFKSEFTELLLLDACRLLNEASVEESIARKTFKVWAGTVRKDIPPNSPEYRLTEELRKIYRSMNKQEFWVACQNHLTN